MVIFHLKFFDNYDDIMDPLGNLLVDIIALNHRDLFNIACPIYT